MMKPEHEALLRRVLKEAGIKETDYTNADWWIQEAKQYGTPELSKAVFLRESWRGIFPAGDINQLKEFLRQLHARRGDGDEGYQSRVARLDPTKIPALQRLLESDDACAIAYLVRAAQIEAVSSLLQLLDGGDRFDDNLDATWALMASDDDDENLKHVGQLIELFWKFDPAKNVTE